MIRAEPSGAREEQPREDHETEYRRKVSKFGEPTEWGRCSDISNRGGRNGYNHHAAEHHAREGRRCSGDKEQAANELHRRNKKSIQIRKRNARFTQRLTHLFPPLSYKKFASPGEKEKEAKLPTVPKEFRAIDARATQQEMSAPTTYIKVKIQIISGQETEKPTIY